MPALLFFSVRPLWGVNVCTVYLIHVTQYSTDFVVVNNFFQLSALTRKPASGAGLFEFKCVNLVLSQTNLSLRPTIRCIWKSGRSHVMQA